MGEGDGDATSSGEEGDCLSNCPASSNMRPAKEAMVEEEGVESSVLPPQGVEPLDDSSPSHMSESPIKRRPGAKAGLGKAQSKKLRQSAGLASKQPLGSIPEHGQQSVTLADLANMTAPMQESPVRVNPATPSDHPETAQEHQHVMTEIDLANDHGDLERGGAAATDLQLESEQTARLCISNKQVNRFVRTILWRRVAERALRGTSFGDIPAEVNPVYVADLLRISEAFAAPLANLFAFVKQGHQPCSFIPQKQLTLYANPLFWQFGLLAFVSGCCAFNNQRRRQNADAAKTTPSKQEEPSEKDVDALTFMRTVIMSFVRGMEHGEQTLPIKDLFVYLPVQILPALVKAIGQQGFQKAEVKSGWGWPGFLCSRLPGFYSQRCTLDSSTMTVFQSRCLKCKT